MYVQSFIHLRNSRLSCILALFQRVSQASLIDWFQALFRAADACTLVLVVCQAHVAVTSLHVHRHHQLTTATHFSQHQTHECKIKEGKDLRVRVLVPISLQCHQCFVKIRCIRPSLRKRMPSGCEFVTTYMIMQYCMSLSLFIHDLLCLGLLNQDNPFVAMWNLPFCANGRHLSCFLKHCLASMIKM